MTRSDAVRAKRLGEVLLRLVPDTVDEGEFDRIVKAIEHSSIPQAMEEVVFAVTSEAP